MAFRIGVMRKRRRVVINHVYFLVRVQGLRVGKQSLFHTRAVFVHLVQCSATGLMKSLVFSSRDVFENCLNNTRMLSFAV